MDILSWINYAFPQDGIYEVILSTTGELDNIAPVGVRRKNGVLRIRVYRETLTLQNITKYPFGVIQVTDDNSLFLETLIRGNQFLSKAKKREAGIPSLDLPLLIVRFDQEVVSDSYIDYLVEPIECKGEPSKAYSRGERIFIDFLVNYTRRNLQISDYDIRKILEYERDVILKTSPWLASLLSFIDPL